MKLLFLWLFGCVALCASAAADWQAELSPAEPGGFPVQRPLHAHYKFGWTAFTAAEATFDYSKGKGGSMRMQVDAKSVGIVRGMWRMDSQHVALMEQATLRPISVRQTETYQHQTAKTRLDFDADGVARLRETTPNDGKPAKAKRFDYPNLFDLNSAIQWVRSQRLNDGATYKIVVYPASAPYLAEVNVEGRQKISAAGKKWSAIKVNLKLWRISDQMELEPHSKFKNAAIWVSDDMNRVLLKIDAEISVGSVWAELDRIEYK